MLTFLTRPQIFKINQKIFEFNHKSLLKKQKNLYNLHINYFKTDRNVVKSKRFNKNNFSTPEIFQSKIFRASLSAIGGSIIFFSCSTIWTYEKIFKQKKNVFGFKKKTNNLISTWWNSLRENQKFFIMIASLNVLVFTAWRVASIQHIMYKYFALGLNNNKTFLPMLLSTFSHNTLSHLFLNMYCLYSFSGISTYQWGKESLLAFYLSAGMFGSLGSLLLKTYTGSMAVSIGASGAVLGLISSVCVLNPDLKISIIFLPFFSFTAQNCLLGILAFDAAGVMLGWKIIDHAGHLGGTLFGIWYSYYGHILAKKYCKKFALAYNKIRS